MVTANPSATIASTCFTERLQLPPTSSTSTPYETSEARGHRAESYRDLGNSEPYKGWGTLGIGTYSVCKATDF